MKKTMIGILSIAIFIIIISCSSDANPQIRIRNERAENVNVKIQTSVNNEFNFNDVEPGQTSEYQTVSEGNITATAILQNESLSFTTVKNTRYTIVISAGRTPSLQIDK